MTTHAPTQPFAPAQRKRVCPFPRRAEGCASSCAGPRVRRFQARGADPAVLLNLAEAARALHVPCVCLKCGARTPPGDPGSVPAHARPTKHGWRPYFSLFELSVWIELGFAPALRVWGELAHRASCDTPASRQFGPERGRAAAPLQLQTKGASPMANLMTWGPDQLRELFEGPADLVRSALDEVAALGLPEGFASRQELEAWLRLRAGRVGDGMPRLTVPACVLDGLLARAWRENIALEDGRRLWDEFSGGEASFLAWGKRDLCALAGLQRVG